MSYENTNCPCGCRKERETMLCRDCQTYTASTIETAVMSDAGRSWQTRRNAAIRLLSIARSRDKRLGLQFTA